MVAGSGGVQIFVPTHFFVQFFSYDTECLPPRGASLINFFVMIGQAGGCAVAKEAERLRNLCSYVQKSFKKSFKTFSKLFQTKFK